MQTKPEDSIQSSEHLYLVLESSWDSHRGLRGRNQHPDGGTSSPSTEAAGDQDRLAGMRHRRFCLGTWLNVTILLFLSGEKVTVTGFTTQLQVELWFTDHLSWAPVLFLRWFTLRFVEKTILGDLAFDTSRSMIYHQNSNVFLSCWKIRWTRSLKQSNLDTGY